jgi:hypothetical protein
MDAVAGGVGLGLLGVLAPFLFTPIPPPLTREIWPTRMPLIGGITRLRHWANPLYVETTTLRSPYRPAYCADEIDKALLRFPWVPIPGGLNIAGYVGGDRFLFKRTTLWANGMRPTGTGRLLDGRPGTVIRLQTAVPAASVYFVLAFVLLLIVFAVVAAVGISTTPRLAILDGVAAGLIVLGVAMVIGAIFAVAASPVSLFGRRTESDHFITFLANVVGAEVISRE